MDKYNKDEKPENINVNKTSPFMKLSSYLSATRPWSFSVSLMPVLLGFILAYQTTSHTNYLVLFFTLWTVSSIHGAGNLVNTYNDFMNGIDNEKSDDKTLVNKLLTKNEVEALGIFFYVIALIGYVALMYLNQELWLYLTFTFFCGFSASIAYSGGIGLKYIALGDVIVLIIFGPVTVLFSYMVQTGTCNWATIFYAIPLALHSEAIIHSNNTRDMESDRKAGIFTLSILIGLPASEVLFALLLLSPYTMFIICCIKYSALFILPVITILEAFSIEKSFRIEGKGPIPKRTSYLNLKAGCLYIFSLWLSPSKSLPFL